MVGLGSMTSQSGWLFFFSIQSFVACAVEMYLTWNLAERERLTLYYDSAEELGRLVGVKCFFFRFDQRSVQNRVCSLYSFLLE